MQYCTLSVLGGGSTLTLAVVSLTYTVKYNTVICVKCGETQPDFLAVRISTRNETARYARYLVHPIPCRTSLLKCASAMNLCYPVSGLGPTSAFSGFSWATRIYQQLHPVACARCDVYATKRSKLCTRSTPANLRLVRPRPPRRAVILTSLVAVHTPTTPVATRRRAGSTLAPEWFFSARHASA